ncbi:hypothetical protein N9B73_09960 [Verrucomicrobiales bacterium]|nr:hypothetical protein [Verrucomicrobiales bacterium]
MNNREESTDEALRNRCAELEQQITQLQIEQREVMEVDRIEALSRMAAWVSHEIKIPLSEIFMAVDFLTRFKMQAPENSQVMVEQIRKASAKVDNVVKKMLEFCSPKELTLAATNIGRLVESVLEKVEPELVSSGISIEKALGPVNSPVLVDEKRMAQALTSICLRSIWSMEVNGTLGIRTYQ